MRSLSLERRMVVFRDLEFFFLLRMFLVWKVVVGRLLALWSEFGGFTLFLRFFGGGGGSGTLFHCYVLKG